MISCMLGRANATSSAEIPGSAAQRYQPHFAFHSHCSTEFKCILLTLSPRARHELAQAACIVSMVFPVACHESSKSFMNAVILTRQSGGKLHWCANIARVGQPHNIPIYSPTLESWCSTGPRRSCSAFSINSNAFPMSPQCQTNGNEKLEDHTAESHQHDVINMAWDTWARTCTEDRQREREREREREKRIGRPGQLALALGMACMIYAVIALGTVLTSFKIVLSCSL